MKEGRMDLQEVVRLAGAFLDMLVLGCGYQSSGWPVFWSPQQVLKAFRWASLFEALIQELPSSKAGEASKQALDEALQNLMNKTPHPPGLPAHLSCTLLAHARKLLIKVMVQAMGIHNGQVGSVLAAILKADEDFPQGFDDRKLLGQGNGSSKRLKVCDTGMVGFCPESSAHHAMKQGESNVEAKKSEHMLNVVVGEILERYKFKSSLELLSKAVGMAVSSLTAPERLSSRSESWREDTSPVDDISCCLSRDFATHIDEVKCYCKRWCQRGLLYLTSVETMYKLSGALLILKEATAEWSKVFDSLQSSISVCNKPCTEEARSVEIAELCCLYLASENWKDIYRAMLCAPCFHLSSQYDFEAHAQAQAQAQAEAQTDFFMPVSGQHFVPLTKEKRQDIEDYLSRLFGHRYHLWWKLPPVLAAAALREGYPLLDHYRKAIINHLEAKISLQSCPCHSCCQSQYCEACEGTVCERIWCMAIRMGQLSNVQSEAEFVSTK